MMKKIFTYFLAALLFSITAMAQTNFTLQASDLIPHDDGFFVEGITYDFNNDGLDETAKGCPGEFDFEDYERRVPSSVTYELHNESGEQLGFTYKNCMILFACPGKYPSELEPPLSEGYIQMRPWIDTSDVDLAYSYIMSPEISNLVSVTMETSADVSIQPDSRLIPYNIEFSVDGGETFEFTPYIPAYVEEQSGFRQTFDSSDPDFAEIITASQTQDIILRFSPNYDNPDLGLNKGQYVKVHKIDIVAEEPGGSGGVLSADLKPEKFDIQIRNHEIFVKDGSLSVHTLSGQLIGTGTSVKVKSGLYIITSSSGLKKKVFIK